MSRDKLIILKPGFGDPAYPGQVFYCWHCVLMDVQALKSLASGEAES